MTSPAEDWEWSPQDGGKWKPPAERIARWFADPATPTLTVTIETSDDGVDWTSAARTGGGGDPPAAT
jgi:hypothetical protein